jgi:hypothetical protein
MALAGPEQTMCLEGKTIATTQAGDYFRLIAIPASSDGDGEAPRTLIL